MKIKGLKVVRFEEKKTFKSDEDTVKHKAVLKNDDITLCITMTEDVRGGLSLDDEVDIIIKSSQQKLK